MNKLMDLQEMPIIRKFIAHIQANMHGTVADHRFQAAH